MKENEKRTENNRIKRSARIYSDIHSFWIRLYEENKNNPNWLIIDGESWIANPFVPNTNNKTRRFMGMGGRMLEAISNDGRKIISNDWWHQGKIPEEFKDLIPDNAKWVK